MKKVLITGASGFVGANLARVLLNTGHEVHLLLRKNSQQDIQKKRRLEPLRGHVQFHEVNLLDVQGTQKMLKGIRAEWIFHLAAHGAYSWENDGQAIVASNVTSLANLLDESSKIGFEGFVNAGSSSEYGFKDHAPKEDEHAQPNSLYAVTKVAATNLCGVIARRNKLSVSTLRLYSAFGPFEDERRFIPALIRHGLKGELPPLVDPDTARDYIYVDDVCDAFVKAAQSVATEFGAVYNIGTGKQTSIKEAVEIAKKVMPVAATPIWGSMISRPFDTSVWVADNAKACTKLDWKPKYDFENGLKATIGWIESEQSSN